MTNMGEVSPVLGMGVTRDREKGTVTITQYNYTKSLLERYGMGNCNPTYTSGVGGELSLNQPEEKLLSKKEKQRFQVITGSVMYPGQVIRYDILYSITNWRGRYPTFQGSHGAGQAPTLLPGWDNGLHHHVQARMFQANDVFGHELDQ